MLQSDLCDYSDAYIVVKGTINVTDPDNNAYDKKLAFKNKAPFISCISKINNTLIDNAEDLDTLSTEDDNKLLEQLKTRFKRTIKWNKYRSEVTKQAKINNLNYLIDPTFNKVNRLFVLSFKNEDDRASFSKYYTESFEIKDFNVLIDGKSFLMFQ